MAKNCIGLDIGSSSVKVVQAKTSKKGVALLNFGLEPLPPQAIVDGTIMNQSAVVDAIRELWSRMKLKQKNVAIAIAGHSVIIKKITVPPMTDDELAEQIPWEAEHHIPFAKDDVELDYQVINRQNASGQMELLLVAAKKEVVHDYAAVAREASLIPEVVDVAAFTVQNGFEVNYKFPPGETVVLVNVGAAIANINIMKDGISAFTRDVTIGGNAFTEEIQKQLNVSHDEAEAYKVGGSLEEHGVVPQEVERIMESVADVMSGEFQRSLDFFLATSADASVTKIYLSGGSAKVGALHRAIEKRSRLTVEVLDAWKNVQLDAKLDQAFLRAHSPEAMVGLGLALRAAGDK
ncbi:MAG: type IV pilus assembly protein PilM [Deltaproteobacteria bacterium]|nr:type IV pilus assembly protein PilM [Deltaproteobacteria bacterium]